MHIAAIGAERNADRFELGSVVTLEDARDQPRNRMVVEIRGEISDANPIVLVELRSSKRGNSGVVLGDEGSGNGKLVCGLEVQRYPDEGRERATRFKSTGELCSLLVGRFPIAAAQSTKNETSASVFVPRLP
jgi:hypothetical protein